MQFPTHDGPTACMLGEELTLSASLGKALGCLWVGVCTGPMETGTGPYWVTSAWSQPLHPQQPACGSPASRAI